MDTATRNQVKEIMRDAWIFLKSGGETKGLLIRVIRNLNVELVFQDCISTLYGESPVNFPTYPDYRAIAAETFDLWDQFGRSEERRTVAGWKEIFWFQR